MNFWTRPTRLAESAPYARHAMAFVLCGRRGKRLMELTDWHANPAVPFGGKARIIDFALSNALNSGIRRIAVATQYKAHSLISHMQRGWNFLRPERNESFDILPASQRVSETMWYLGSADAIYQNIDIIESYAPEYMVVLAGDHVYKMDYEKLLRQHVESGADVTVGCLETSVEEAERCGAVSVDEDDRIRSFVKKPGNAPAAPGRRNAPLCGMGVYAFETNFLIEDSSAVPPTKTPRTVSARTSFPTSSPTARPSRTAFRNPAWCRGTKRIPTGGTSERWTPIGRPTSI